MQSLIIKNEYRTEALPLERKQYISNAKIQLAEEALEYFFAEYGEGIRRPASKQMEEGQRLHYMVLEREKFKQNRVVHRFRDLKTSQAQTWLAQVSKEYPEATVMSIEESLKYDRIIDRVMSHPTAGPIISQSIKERHGYAICPRTGLVLYSRPDIVTAQGWIADLKFVQSVDLQRFNRQQYEMKWFVQLAFYNAVDGLIRGHRQADNCMFIAVEHTYPHRMAIIPLDPQFEAMGELIWNDALDKIKRCLDRDPQMKNFEVWREESYTARAASPELWMLTKDARFAGIIGA